MELPNIKWIISVMFLSTTVTESQKFRELWHGRTEFIQVSGRYKNAVPIPQVFVAWASRAYRSSGYMYECRTDIQKFFVG